MSEYIVSARKYRPSSFAALIGQDNIAQTLKNSITRGQLAHAYLFCGPRGVGKTSAARIFAKTINCANPGPDMEPCGECESCRSFAEGRSYCIHELDAASNNSVEDIKSLIEQVNIPPQTGRYSVFIVDEVHMLSPSAFNAFLKTLEEPPAHAIFILATTEKHKILPTILSRCQTYDFNRISVPDIVRNLRDIAAKEGVTADDESLHVIAMKADGAMRDALTIFDQTVAFCGTDIKADEVMKNLNVLSYDYSFALVDDFLSGNKDDALLKFDEILSKGFNALHFIGSLSTHLRNLVVAKSDGLKALLELPESVIGRLKEQASRCQYKFLYDALSLTVACESGYKASINPRLHIEFCLMRLCALGVPPVAAPSASASPAPAPAAPVATPEASAAAPLVAPAAPPASPSAVVAPARPADTALAADAVSGASASSAPDASASSPDASATAPSAAPATSADAPAAPVATPAASAAAPLADSAPAPAPRRRKAAGSLSLSSLRNSESSALRQPASATEESGTVPSDEEILAAWKTLGENYTERPRLQTALLGAKVDIFEAEGGKNVTFFVVNVAQVAWIRDNCLRDLEGRLRRILGSSRVLLHVDAIPEEESVKQSYTQREQAEELMKSNPEIRNLVQDMGLDA